MSASGSTANVALRPLPAPKKEVLEPADLFAQVGQLTSERGHLRFITEDSLKGDIEAGKDGTEEDVMQGIEQAEEKPAPTRQERIQEIGRVRNEMWHKLEWANFYASNTLDLVALILSKDASRNVDRSFSAQFKAQRIPRGSFGVDKISEGEKKQHEIDMQAEKEKREFFSAQGSRMQALDWATDSILKAAAHLEKEVRKETRYWDEVLSISQKGWSIQRLRQQSRHSPYAVRYGFPEASDHFKARGLAPLRMDKDGSIILDPALALQPKTLRVRVTENGQATGTSTLSTQANGTDLAIEKSIQLARDSLFEEEIYHEISLETRQLLAYDVELRDSVVHIALPDQGSKQRRLLIDCIARDDESTATTGQSQDWLAQNVAEALRLLLAHEHRMRLFRRSQIPAPVTKIKRPHPNPPLLRTLLAMFKHLNAVDSLYTNLNRTARILSSAGLNVSLEMIRETSWNDLTNVIQSSQRKDLAPVDQILEVFTKPLSGRATLTLPSANGSASESVTIAILTSMGAPTFGTEFKVSLPPSSVAVLNLAQDQPREFKFPSAEEVTSYMDWLLSLDLAHTLLVKEYGNRAFIRSKDARVTIKARDGKKVTDRDVVVQLGGGVLKVDVPRRGPDEGKVFMWTGEEGQVAFGEQIKNCVR